MPRNPQLEKLCILSHAIIDSLNRGEVDELNSLFEARGAEIDRITAMDASFSAEDLAEIQTAQDKIYHLVRIARDLALRETRMANSDRRAARAYAKPTYRGFDLAG